MRASLDMVAAALAKRNGIVPDRNTIFPIYNSSGVASDPSRGLDSPVCKRWLPDAERAILKSLKPYRGGDSVLWPLKKLDNLFKHERLVIAETVILGMSAFGSRKMLLSGTRSVIHKGKKTFMLRIPSTEAFRPSYGNTLPSFDMVINEPAVGFIEVSVVPLLREFGARTRQIIALFDT